MTLGCIVCFSKWMHQRLFLRSWTRTARISDYLRNGTSKLRFWYSRALLNDFCPRKSRNYTSVYNHVHGLALAVVKLVSCSGPARFRRILTAVVYSDRHSEYIQTPAAHDALEFEGPIARLERGGVLRGSCPILPSRHVFVSIWWAGCEYLTN